MKKDQRGIAAVVEILLVTVILAGVGYAGWRVWQSNQDGDDNAGTSQGPESETWEEAGFAVAGTYADADVIKISDDMWRLYYSIQPEVAGNKLEVYSSTSSDGKTWTREPGTRKTMATFPDVVKTSEGKYRMYFQQAGVIKSAISSDGLSFTDESGTRVDTANGENLTFDNVAAPTVLLLDDGTYMMVYRGTINERYAADTPNATTQLLMWATSTDGLAFTKKGIAVDSRNATLRGQLDGPDLVKWDDDKLHLFSTTYAGVYEFVFDADKFSTGELAYALEADTNTQGNAPADVAPPGDPTTAKIGGVWHMFYGGPKTKNGINYATYE